MMLLVVVEHDRGVLAPATQEALTGARSIAQRLGVVICALTIGGAADGLAAELDVATVYQAHDDVLGDYGPEAWGETVAAFVRAHNVPYVLACGTDRGNEVLAQAAARLDVPFIANCSDVRPTGSGIAVTRVRWGGSLLEEATAEGTRLLFSVTHHAFEAATSASANTPSVEVFEPRIDPKLARTVVADRVDRTAGVTLATAPFVVGGGRGVGSPEGFAPLEELAALLGGVVGCSRAVTNNGWRNHTDQVGQTGTRIAPDLYFACGISGAIQHWVGAMASKQILAINIDPQANMVSRADYAVIGDLHQVVPAISAEIKRRRAERS